MRSINRLLSIGYDCRLTIVKKIINRIIRIRYSCDIPCQAKIDKSVIFAHDALGVVIHQDAIIKENAAIGPGAIIIGKVTVGENAVVGSGAVVTKDVPPFAVVAGVPARILHYLNEKEQ